MELDKTDGRLLSALQTNAHLTSQELGEVLGLSPSQVGRRRQRLECEGYITGYAARLDAEKLGLGVQAFLQVQLATHAPDAANELKEMLAKLPAVTGAWAMTGDADYLLRVVCEDLPALNHIIHDILLPHTAVSRVHSQIVMNQFKADAPLPT
ncbi:Lrp/AsnC family transcriptional regulator [Actibacterium lipolyticum]|uniref:Leucine-responsive regulatory protein n=1 Tax=Actibacterium lipolyticum TaxID=1524263 RepID=A0A238JV37_9RHOB|nr:Lrp/AsnC family transcriptional regulator [Actibacterium lipolyticum]SMX33616.1 Leucine-responsive regulatory protein [Actibacterium lipolyticum]